MSRDGPIITPLDALVDRCEHAPILQGNEGMRGPFKYQRKYLGAKPASRPTEAASIRPVAGWIGPDGQRANGPVEA